MVTKNKMRNRHYDNNYLHKSTSFRSPHTWRPSHFALRVIMIWFLDCHDLYYLPPFLYYLPTFLLSFPPFFLPSLLDVFPSPSYYGLVLCQHFIGNMNNVCIAGTGP